MSSHQNVFQPSVTSAITGVLVKHGYRNGDVEDAVREVQVRVIEALDGRESPGTLPEWQALSAKVAADFAVDAHRKEEVRGKYDIGLCEAPDDHAPLLPSGEARDPVDTRRQLAVLLEMFESGAMPEKGREILEGVADGMKMPQIGREVGLPAEEVRARLRGMRRLFFKKLATLGMLGIALALLLLGGGSTMVATRTRPGAGPSAAPSGENRALSPQELAAVVRREALRACDAGRWQECEARLDDARGMDPQGENEAEVREARARVREARAIQELDLRTKPR